MNQELDSEELQEQIQTAVQEALVSKQAMEANFAMAVALENILQSKLSKDHIPLVASTTVNTAMEAIGVGSNVDYSKLSLEEIAREKKRFWEQFKFHLSDSFKRWADSVQLFFTFTHQQSKRIRAIKSQLSNVRSNAKAQLRVGASKYLKYGKGELTTDSKQYLEKFSEMKTVMGKMCDTALSLNDLSKFNIPSYLVSKVTWNGDEFVLNHFEALNELAKGMVKTEGLKFFRKSESSEVHISELMLGLSQVVCKLPIQKNVKYGDYDSAIDNVGLIYMFIDRIEKFGLESTAGGSVVMTFEKRQIEELVGMCESLLSEAENLLGFAQKYNHFIDNLMATLSVVGAMVEPAYSAMYKTTKMDPEAVDILPSMRIIVRYMNMTNDCTSGTYNFSMGNIKKALSISEQYLKQAG